MDYQTRRQVRAQSTRRAILDAAVRLTSQVGFDKVTVRDICRAAGVTTGAFYHHFASKEDLLNQGFASLDVYLEEALAPYRTAPPLERLNALLRLYAAFITDQGWETVSRYYSRRMADQSAASMDPSRFTLRTMGECLQALSADGALSPAFPPAWTADFFFRHFRGVVIDWLLHRGSYSLQDRLEQDYRFFERAFRA